jgi:hypothetical protein
MHTQACVSCKDIAHNINNSSLRSRCAQTINLQSKCTHPYKCTCTHAHTHTHTHNHTLTHSHARTHVCVCALGYLCFVCTLAGPCRRPSSGCCSTPGADVQSIISCCTLTQIRMTSFSCTQYGTFFSERAAFECVL